jgi:uncharacterized membrane protein
MELCVSIAAFLSLIAILLVVGVDVRTRRSAARIEELARQVAALRQALAAAGLAPPVGPPEDRSRTTGVARPGTVPARSPVAAPSGTGPAPAAPPGGHAPAPGVPPAGTVPAAAGAPAGAGRTLAPGAEASAQATGSVPARPPARPTVSWEEQFGARLPVWVGAIALALAGVFLVKYTVDRGWIGPAVRVMLGVLFGAGLLVVGEVTERASRRIAAGLSAAGVAVLYASFLAASDAYHLIPPLAAFVLMALTTVAAIGLSLRRGMLVAVVGLVGGYLTPLLVDTAAEPDPRGLFIYLLLLEVALLGVATRRRWLAVAGMALAGAGLWVLMWLFGTFEPADALWLNLFLLASFAAALVAGLGREAEEDWGTPRAARLLVSISTVGVIVLQAVVAISAGLRPLDWAFVALLTGACLVLARREPTYTGLDVVAASVAALLLLVYDLDALVDRFAAPGTGAGGITFTGALREVWPHALLAAVVVGGGYAAMWGARRPGWWAGLVAAAGVTYALLSYAPMHAADVAGPWGIASLALGALFIALALPVARRRAVLAQSDIALAALAAAATTFISFAVPLQLERTWLTVAWAIEVPALIWIARRTRVPALRLFAWALGALVALRLLANPFIVDYPIGRWPLLNWLLYGYGVPALAFCAGAWQCRHDDPRLSRALQWGAIALGLGGISLEVHHYHQGGRLDSWTMSLAELGSLSVAWLACAIVLLWAGRRHDLDVARQGGTGILGLGTLGALGLQGFTFNPVWNDLAVGSRPVVNLLVWAFAVPAALVIAGARQIAGSDDLRRLYRLALSTAAILLAFLFVSLEVRQAFHGNILAYGEVSTLENYAYSLAWVLFGLVLLAVGVLRGSQLARYASLAVMLLSVAKVFLYDMSILGDLYRVLSFLGLGVSLLVLAYVYQRFVFTDRKGGTP